MTKPFQSSARHLAAPLAWICLAAALGGSPNSAYARTKVQPEGPNDAELTMLPEVCTARIKGSKEVRAFWEKRIGPDNFLHIHHYCFGLNYINRARMTFDKQDKQYMLQRALANFNYVLRHWPANSPLRPDAEAGKRQVEFMMRLP